MPVWAHPGRSYAPCPPPGRLPHAGPRYKYLVEFHIVPEFQGRELRSLTFEEIEAWEKAIPTRTSARETPYARSVAQGARSLLITILGDAVHAGKIDRNPAERRKGRRGRVQAKGRRAPAHTAGQATSNVLTRSRPSAWPSDAPCFPGTPPIS